MTGLQVNIMNLIDLVNLGEKHVRGRLPPTEDKKDANKLSPVRENERKPSL